MLRRRICVVVCALALAACGVQRAPPPGAPGGFDATAADPRAPCSLVTTTEAAEIAGAPFRDHMARDRILGPQTTCSWQVGDRGAPGLVQLTIGHGDSAVSAAELFTLRCGPEATSACTMPSGLVVRLAGDWTVEASVQKPDGVVDPARSERLADLAATRVAALRADAAKSSRTTVETEKAAPAVAAPN
jgi:hypothetical protein